MRTLDGVSHKVLTQTLRDLEVFGLIERHDFSELPLRVEYSLTSRGTSLAELLGSVDEWVIENYGALISDAERNQGARQVVEP